MEFLIFALCCSHFLRNVHVDSAKFSLGPACGAIHREFEHYEIVVSARCSSRSVQSGPVCIGCAISVDPSLPLLVTLQKMSIDMVVSQINVYQWTEVSSKLQHDLVKSIYYPYRAA